MTARLPKISRAVTPTTLIWAATAAAALWAVWSPTALEWFQRWSEDPTYSHGFLVPLFALGLLWWKRHAIAAVIPRPSWWGVLVVAAGGLIQFIGSYYYIRWLQGASFLVYLAGGTLVVGGWPLLRHSWHAIAFLVFMIPLPYFVEASMRAPLQELATISSTFLLQLLGLPAIANGNVIEIETHRLGVAEACSGLKMLITFVALAVALVMVVRRPLLDKVVILASAVPIAVASNIIRITVTGVLYTTTDAKVAEFVYHELAGYLMMPLGIALMWLELMLLDRLLMAPEMPDPAALRPVVLGAELGLPLGGAPAKKPKPRHVSDLD